MGKNGNERRKMREGKRGQKINEKIILKSK